MSAKDVPHNILGIMLYAPSDSSFSSSFFSSAFSSAAAPPAAAPPDGAATAAGAPPPDPTLVNNSLTSLPSKALAKRVAQMGSTGTLAAAVKATIFSLYDVE